MHLTQVISYGNAWSTLVQQHPIEFADIDRLIREIDRVSIAAAQPIRDVYHQQEPGVSRYRLDGLWISKIQDFGWEESNSSIRGAAGRPIHMRGLGYTRNSVSVVLHRHRELINRWLYTLAPIATRNNIIDVPVGIALLSPAEEALFGRRPLLSSAFERTKEELLALSPLSHANPFLLLGLSLDPAPLEITEIESDGEWTGEQIVINRSIEFPPEYHQAGLGILSYFGAVLREKCPEHNAKVKIEQDGLKVRLVIESENGDREIIEKALQEYELVVRGESPPESLFDSRTKVLELKNELRIAQVRIESQKDLMALQGDQIESLRALFGHALTVHKAQPISVSVNPIISISSATHASFQQSVPIISEHLQELAGLAANDPDAQMRLLDLDESIISMSGKQTLEAVRDSSGLKKLKRFIDDAVTAGSSVHNFFGKVSDGFDLLQKLARRYNDIAEWCGAPQVPRVFVGKEP